jgi:SAM-dependent methyltransferase
VSWDEVFDDDYLYFYETFLTDERSDVDADAIWRLLELEAGMEVLDLACGHGRIANRLAARGVRVTGLDASAAFLELARRDAEARGLDVEYVEGDMRDLPWSGRFDAIVSWFTAFGYFADDAENKRVLAEAHRAIAPGGRLLINLNNLAGLLRVLQPSTVTERDGDLLVDQHRFDVASNAMHSKRTIVRAGRTRDVEYRLRMFTFPELRDWFHEAGFSAVVCVDNNGDEVTLESYRMNVIGRASGAS